MNEYTYSDLCAIISRLRKECPWDKKQTHESLCSSIIEEAYEFVDAVDRHAAHDMCEELGDVLMLTVLHSVIAEETGEFTNRDVIDRICRKMISRHSHVFGDDKVSCAEDTIALWDKNKGKERGHVSPVDALRSVPRSFPALLRAQKMQSCVAKATTMTNNENPGLSEYIDELSASISRLESANTADTKELTYIIGEILWQISNISRLHKINAEFALTNTLETFITRFETGSSHQAN